MTPKVPASLGTVPETLLIPLYGRAELTRQGSDLIRDPKAVEMVDAIAYDFSKFDGLPSLLGSVARTRIFDHWVARWLAEHRGGTVVEVGAGLNTRFERIDDGAVRWFDLDLPDAMALRRRFFADSDRRRMIDGSVTDAAWVDAIGPDPGPWVFVIEAVLSYLSEVDVRRALGLIAEHFPGAGVVFDTWGEWMREHQDEHDALQMMDARVEWFWEEPAELEGWGLGLELRESCIMPDGPAEVRALLPPTMREMLPALAADPQVQAYKLNRFAVAGAGV